MLCRGYFKPLSFRPMGCTLKMTGVLIECFQYVFLSFMLELAKISYMGINQVGFEVLHNGRNALCPKNVSLLQYSFPALKTPCNKCMIIYCVNALTFMI